MSETLLIFSNHFEEFSRLARGGRREGAGRKPTPRHASFMESRRMREVEESFREGSIGEVFRGVSYDRAGRAAPGSRSRAGLWATYDKLFLTRSEVSSAVLTIAGHVVSRGYVTIPGRADDARAQKAKELCDDYALLNNLDVMIDEGSIFLPLHGTTFLENSFVGRRLVATRVFPWQSEIEPDKLERDGTVKTYHQMRDNNEVVKFREGEIVALRFPPVDRFGYGTSLIASTVEILNTRTQFDTDVKEYIHKSTWPKELWQLGDANDKVDKETADDAYSKVKNWVAGDAFVVNYPAKYTPCGLGNVESRIFPDLIKVLNDRCIDGMLVPPVSYLRSATEASADALMGNLRVAVAQPIQRLWKRAVEGAIFKPLLIGEGYNEKEVARYVPRISFTPPTEKELMLRTQRVATVKTAGIAGAAYAQDQLDIYDPAYRSEKAGMSPPPAKPKDTTAQAEQPPEKQSPIPKGEQPKREVT